MRAYYEDLWERLPEERELPDFELRAGFLQRRLAPGMSVLDLGCGAGEFTALISESGANVIGAEVAEAAILIAQRKYPDEDFRLVPFDGELPFEDGSFELIWASEVIEHVADTERWLREVHRILGPRGTLLLTTPAHGRLRLLLGGIERYSPPLGDHLHLYTSRSLAGVLSELGFAQVTIRTAGGVPLFKRLLLATAVGPG
ncbi:MAG: class I SAM-dependent methyltransferase [Solirubrobacteraceae bacterium]